MPTVGIWATPNSPRTWPPGPQPLSAGLTGKCQAPKFCNLNQGEIWILKDNLDERQDSSLVRWIWQASTTWSHHEEQRRGRGDRQQPGQRDYVSSSMLGRQAWDQHVAAQEPEQCMPWSQCHMKWWEHCEWQLFTLRWRCVYSDSGFPLTVLINIFPFTIRWKWQVHSRESM